MMCCDSSASLPPCQPRSGTQRALRGQSPATVHQPALQQQQQPSWAFIGANNTSTHSGLTVNSQTPLATWQSANHNRVVAAGNLLWRPPAHLDQTAAAAAVSLPWILYMF